MKSKDGGLGRPARTDGALGFLLLSWVVCLKEVQLFEHAHWVGRSGLFQRGCTCHLKAEEGEEEEREAWREVFCGFHEDFSYLIYVHYLQRYSKCYESMTGECLFLLPTCYTWDTVLSI